MAGYSGTPLGKKLGIKPGQAVLLQGAPPSFEAELRPLPAEVGRPTPRAAWRAHRPVAAFI